MFLQSIKVSVHYIRGFPIFHMMKMASSDNEPVPTTETHWSEYEDKSFMARILTFLMLYYFRYFPQATTVSQAYLRSHIQHPLQNLLLVNYFRNNFSWDMAAKAILCWDSIRKCLPSLCGAWGIVSDNSRNFKIDPEMVEEVVNFNSGQMWQFIHQTSPSYGRDITQ